MALIKCKECGHGISTKAKSCPNCGAPLEKPISVILRIIAIVFIFFIILIGIGSLCADKTETYTSPYRRSTSKTTLSQNDWQKPNQSELLQLSKSNYTIEEFKNLSYGNVVRLGFRIRIKKPLSEKELRGICQEIISKEKKQHPHNAISFFFYLPNTGIHGAYTGGSADWAPYGDWGEANTISTGDYSKHKLVVKVGSALGKVPKSIETQLPLSKRRKIFYDIVAAEDKGMRDTEAYPLIAKKYGVEVDIVEKIGIEGVFKGWPMP